MPSWLRISLISIGLIAGLALLLAVIWVPTSVLLGRGGGEDVIRIDDAIIAGRSATGEKWEMRVGQVRVTKDRGYIHLRDIRDGFLTVDDKPLLTLDAAAADYNRASRQLSLIGRVRMAYKERVQLEGSGIVWDSRTNHLTTVSEVTVKVRGVVAKGRNLNLDMKKGTLTMDQVRAKLQPSVLSQTGRANGLVPSLSRLRDTRRLAVTGLVWLSLAASIVTANAPQESAAPAKPTDTQEKPIDITGDHLRYTDATSEWRYWGNVVAIQNDTWFLCDEIIYNDVTKQGSCLGNIKITDPKLDMTGDKVEFDTEAKMAVITGHVIATYHQEEKKPSDASQPDAKEGGSLAEKIKGDVVMTCDRVEYNYADKIAVMTGGVHIESDAWTVTANRVTYARETEIAELVGNVHAVHKTKKHVFDAPKVRISFAKGNEWIEADKEDKTPIRATVMIEEKEKKSSETPQAPGE